MIPFNKPYLTGKETTYITEAVQSGRISGNGAYTYLCQNYFQNQYSFLKTLLTTSCSDALEMAAILMNIKPGDEVIVPSYTFVSTANAFVREGAKIVFCDSRPDHPGIDESKLEELISPKTKAIVPVHYAGVASDMDSILDLAQKHNIAVIEDAAHAVDAYYTERGGRRIRLGGIGDLGTFSFHETKNIISGEGGLLIINNEAFAKRAEIIWEKGTDRAAFTRGEVDKYGWVDVGSSFLPSEIVSAFLWAQLENLEKIQAKRISLWHNYNDSLVHWTNHKGIQLPSIPSFASVNGHMFYIVCESLKQRQHIQQRLKSKDIQAVSHYISLHSSPFYERKHDGRKLPNSDRYTHCLLRLPMFYTLSEQQQMRIIDEIQQI
jgi:dTDP-4-amino-4,6-dideoxygalactose transaminase